MERDRKMRERGGEEEDNIAVEEEGTGGSRESEARLREALEKKEVYNSNSNSNSSRINREKDGCRGQRTMGQSLLYCRT